jgi:hypothetical protein
MRAIVLAAATTAVLAAGGGVAEGFRTTVKPYAKATPGSGWRTTPLLSSGDVVRETGAGPGRQYRMVGIPDGLGVERRRHGMARVYMTHELAQDVVSEPKVGRPPQRGAFATIARVRRNGDVVSARRAFDTVYQDGTLVGPAADTSNTTPAFSRWCSAFLAGREVGFDRPIFFGNEETGPERPAADGSQPPTKAFSPLGSQSVAIFDDEAHALSRLGHFPRENTVVMRGTGRRTVILMTEDGPRTADSQLYLYVGRKVPSSRRALRRNGLDNGRLYVFASDDARDDENQLLQGDTVHGTWKEIAGARSLSDVATEAAADAAGAFAFVRLEDGEFRPGAKREFWFHATGDQTGRPETDSHTNELGRLYRLRFDRANPLRGATLLQAYNADQLQAGEDGPLSPDNIAVARRYAIVNEDGTAGAAADGTTGSRDDMDRRDRDGSIWLVPLASAGAPATFHRVAELVGRGEGGRDGIRTVDERGNRAGVWETSGIVDARAAFGRDTFLFDVQAHAPTTAPGGRPVTVEDGQLLLLRRKR